MKIGVTYTYMGVEGICWGYIIYEANSMKEAKHFAFMDNLNLENFKIIEMNVVPKEAKPVNKCHMVDHTPQWAGDGYFCSTCGIMFKTGETVDKNILLHELDTMTCASSKEFQAGYKMAVQDAKDRIKQILK